MIDNSNKKKCPHCGMEDDSEYYAFEVYFEGFDESDRVSINARTFKEAAEKFAALHNEGMESVCYDLDVFSYESGITKNFRVETVAMLLHEAKETKQVK